MTCPLDNVLILQGEVACRSLLGVEGLKDIKNKFSLQLLLFIYSNFISSWIFDNVMTKWTFCIQTVLTKVVIIKTSPPFFLLALSFSDPFLFLS